MITSSAPARVILSVNLVTAFRRAGLDWQDHVIVDDKLIRKIDSYHTTADSSKVRARLGWRPKTSFQELVN